MSRAREVADLGQVTSTPAELNKLDGYTGDHTDLNYAKDLKATGVTDTEFNYLDGVGSDLQTQINAKQATITTGISNTNILAANANVADDDFLRVDGTSIEGRTASETLSDIGAQSSTTLVGMIAPFAHSSTPTGFLACDGAAVSRSTYSALFSAIGTTWGTGDGSSTFNVPDLRGAILRGTGTAGVSGDYVGPSVGGYQNDQNAEHNHSASSSSSTSVSGSTNTTGNHSHSYSRATTNNTGQGLPAYNYPNGGTSPSTGTSGNHSHSVSVSASTSTTTTIGNQGSTEVRMYNRGVSYFIRF
tara:strand:+ start:359 stop:1264 length:906 start_codon:yes stop_codon:yes gene_type:complete